MLAMRLKRGKLERRENHEVQRFGGAATQGSLPTTCLRRFPGVLKELDQI